MDKDGVSMGGGGTLSNARAGSRRAPTGSGYRFLYVILSNIKHLLSLIKHLWKLEQMELSDSNLKYLFIRLWINAEALPFLVRFKSSCKTV